jgi:hypothetical protein
MNKQTFEIISEDHSRPEPPNVYTAIPSNGKVCPYTGLKHAHLYLLLAPEGVARPHVRVVNLRRPGAKRGKTLFHVGDFFNYLEQVANKTRYERG